MKVGLIARGEDRGLGIQTWEAYRHLRPERTLLVDMGELGRGFAVHADRYPDATVASFDGHQFPDTVRDWLDGLDVVLSCETLYDWRLADWGREQGVATVVQVNPEFYKHHDLDLPHPTMWWNPTTWRHDHLPRSARHVPVPVALDRFAQTARPDREEPRFLHVVGKRAAGDRNGTQLLVMALRRTRSTFTIEVVTQERRMPSMNVQRNLDLRVRLGGREDYWDLYEDFDALVLPRRYGGLCLPAQEAMAAGMAVLMPACEPNTAMWPVLPLRCEPGIELNTPGGPVVLADTDLRSMAAAMDGLVENRQQLAHHQAEASAWAATHSWAALAGLYADELARAADRAPHPAA